MRRFVILAVLLAGCDLYFTDGDDEPPCDYGAPAFAPEQYRNPDTGVCQDFGGYPCDGVCGPCAETTDQAQPNWGSCYSKCEGMTENACKAEPGCFAAYNEFPGDIDRKAEYRGCWQTAPSGPVGGSCTNLGAQQCSEHDNCTAHYDGTNFLRTTPVRSTFLACKDEVSAICAAADCAPGTHCEEQCMTVNGQLTCKPICVPDTNACTAIDCGPGWDCVEVCTNGTCGAQCVPSGTCETITTEAACKTRTDCVTVYQGDDCTCYPDHCTCNVLTYERCEAK